MNKANQEISGSRDVDVGHVLAIDGVVAVRVDPRAIEIDVWGNGLVWEGSGNVIPGFNILIVGVVTEIKIIQGHDDFLIVEMLQSTRQDITLVRIDEQGAKGAALNLKGGAAVVMGVIPVRTHQDVVLQVILILQRLSRKYGGVDVIVVRGDMQAVRVKVSYVWQLEIVMSGHVFWIIAQWQLVDEVNFTGFTSFHANGWAREGVIIQPCG